MITFEFRLSNPWSDRWRLVVAKNKHWKKAHKVLECNLYKTSTIARIEVNCNPAGDHAGVRCMIGAFGFDVELHFYDTRHADRR
jgi:hypothetical protein